MPVIASFIYDPGAEFAVQRQYLSLFAVGWWDNTILVTAGNPSVYQEVPYGGYQLHMKFKDWFYAWDDRSVMLKDLFEDFYITPPGGGPPVPPFAASVQYEVVQNWRAPCITIGLYASDNYFWFQRFPPPDRPYWRSMMDIAPMTPFPFDGTP